MPGHEATVFLHIGLPKTGTTYVQDLVRANKKALRKAGVVFPGQPSLHFRASNDLRGEAFANDPTTLQPGSWDKVARRARTAPDRALISHETLGWATPEKAKKAVASLAPSEVHLIVTVRDLTRQVPAVWQEWLKNASTETYVSFLKQISEKPESTAYQNFWRSQDVTGTLERWSEVPAERIHVVTVPPPGGPRGLLWERFASVIGVDPAIATAKPARSNTSLGASEAELLRRINPTLRARAADRRAYAIAVKHRFAVDVLAGTVRGERIVVPPEHQEWVAERGKAMIEALGQGGYHIVGDLADLEPAFDGGDHLAPGDVSQAQLLRIAGECVARQAMDNSALRDRVRELEKELAKPAPPPQHLAPEPSQPPAELMPALEVSPARQKFRDFRGVVRRKLGRPPWQPHAVSPTRQRIREVRGRIRRMLGKPR